MFDYERVVKVVNWLIFEQTVKSRRDLANKLGYTESSLSQILNQKVPLSEKFIKKLSVLDKRINLNWLLAGEGEMLVDTGAQPGRLIPLYDNVTTIGGMNELVANVDDSPRHTEYIDAGDWFRDATAAIRHYGDSMIEYPTGCILAIKEVTNRDLLIPGRDYVIETSEYRVTKRVQKGKDGEHITCYSTNTETYPDGRMVHEPFDVPVKAILHIFIVLGYVVKKNGATKVYNAKK